MKRYASHISATRTMISTRPCGLPSEIYSGKCRGGVNLQHSTLSKIIIVSARSVAFPCVRSPQAQQSKQQREWVRRSSRFSSSRFASFPLSLSLTHTHTHTHLYTFHEGRIMWRKLFVWYLQTHILKVNIHCDGCRLKVKKLLHRIEGTLSFI